ncbi:unnamed protein product [Prorocentrum cordatum]|uniref:Trypanosomal VSG domain containing protein n=1 Tax=Prorocentrum cordatum TaxID=2364126 RepID=A0ABN9VG77_9DINO|nr:unnamed protein product [Polarella glacialis]
MRLWVDPDSLHDDVADAPPTSTMHRQCVADASPMRRDPPSDPTCSGPVWVASARGRSPSGASAEGRPSFSVGPRPRGPACGAAGEVFFGGKHIMINIKANKYVENEYQGLAEVFKRLKMESTATVDDWKKHAGALSQACDKVRDDLKELGSTASKGKCTKAEDVALPQLFKRRSHQRSRPKDTIEGCAVVDDRKALTPTDCNCAAGDEAKGCKDAANDSDHVLQCAHLRRRDLDTTQS